MILSGSTCVESNVVRGRTETLDKMGNDVEEGEISDMESVEEISEEDFIMLERRINGGYSSSLYNLAWPDDVQLQKKRINESVVMGVDRECKSGQQVDEIVIVDSDNEMEEGELEEGEIDLDAELIERVGDDIEGGTLNDHNMKFDKLAIDRKENELEKRVNSVRDSLISITFVYAKNSFDGVCFLLEKNLDRLREVVSENSVDTMDALVQLSFSAVQVVNSVFLAMNHIEKEQNKDTYYRLLSTVKSFDHSLFSPDQMKEIEAGMTFVESFDVLSSTRDCNKEKTIMGMDAVTSDPEYLAENKLSVESLVNSPNKLLEGLKQLPSSFKSKGLLVPLLDLHKDHDADGLPSPTRKTPSCLPVNRAFALGDGMMRSKLNMAKIAHEMANTRHIYETDAFKAVSTYQQKFGQSSFVSHDRLPSPTPSEECDDGDEDIRGDVSSSSMFSDMRTVNSLSSEQLMVLSSPCMDSSSMQGTVVRNVAPLSPGSYPTGKGSLNSNDPRLRFSRCDVGASKLDNTSEILGSRKQKTAEEPILDGPALKKQRNGLEKPGIMRHVKAVSGTGGWLEDNGNVWPLLMNRNQLMENVVDGESCPNTVSGEHARVNGTEPVTVMNTTPSLPMLSKVDAVNPTMLMNILKQRLAADALQKSADLVKSTSPSLGLNAILGNSNMVNIGPESTLGLLPKPAVPVVPSGKIRMKRRDPRRVLLNNELHSKDRMKARKLERQTDAKSTTPLSVVPTDTAQQYTKNLKSISDIMPVSLELTILPVVSQNPCSQPVQTKPDRFDGNSLVSNAREQSMTVSTREAGASGPLQSPTKWGDVEHLLEGYNEQQRATIHQERARRIDEQKKMFAACKLCLVLDLDHTLLNSARFVEVDPVHDEILRKKEEQDREKTLRHLFRIPRMGMWTKLRPGVWNFLEKASKLFELHVYTMGNKPYATEMAKVLDPKGVLFAGRVISRGDDEDPVDGDGRAPKTKDLEGVLGMESGVLIIDDSVRVWPYHKLNLITVERYTYFPCSRRQFGLHGPSLLEIDYDERLEDGTLASAFAVIERIHQKFFSHPNISKVDVRNILASEQRKILASCRIVFSRVFPVGDASPHLHPLWQTAEQFGAVCTTQIDDHVTHVVANSPGTYKVNWARSTGRFVVHPGWVEASALLYRRANEQDFSIK